MEYIIILIILVYLGVSLLRVMISLAAMGYTEINNKLYELRVKKITRLLEKKDYYTKVYPILDELFNDSEISKTIQCSFQLVSNFSSYKKYDYLCSYFNLHINEGTIFLLKKMKDIVADAKSVSNGSERDNEIIYDLLPSCSMFYLSPAGKSSRKYTFYFDEDNIEELINKIKKINESRVLPEYERAKITKDIRETVLRRDNFTCCKCGASLFDEPNLLLEVDHIIPVSKGGKSNIDNLQTLCWKCNRSKSSKIA